MEVGGNTVVLEFEEGTPLAGATVKASLDMPLRDFIALQRTLAETRSNEDQVPAERLDLLGEAFRQFGDGVLLEWDLTLGGEALPPTGEGMLALPYRAANAIVGAWTSALSAEGNSDAASESGEAGAA